MVVNQVIQPLAGGLDHVDVLASTEISRITVTAAASLLGGQQE